MSANNKRTLILRVIQGVTLFFSIFIGISLGWSLGESSNKQRDRDFGKAEAALPTQILDINGNLITEFFSDEKRELVSIKDLPPHLIKALLAREDKNFFKHSGFDIEGFSRALFNILTGRYVSGGSTLSQQLAGNLYADRTQLNVSRKLVELWYAFQMERKLTKWEILEDYLNRMPFGDGNWGVEASSQYYFEHPSSDITIAESAMLVIQLANQRIYNPISQPASAMVIQRAVLNHLVELGYYTQEEVDYSYESYWDNYDWGRDPGSNAFFDREDKAPYFSEYIRQELESTIYGAKNIYKDGFLVHTTLDLDYQAKADEMMAYHLNRVNKMYKSNMQQRAQAANQVFIPIIDMLSLAFGIENIKVAGKQDQQTARRIFDKDLAHVVNMLSLMTSNKELQQVAKMSLDGQREQRKKQVVEGALITIDNRNGYILSMVGGSKFEQHNQYNRAVDGVMQPGSSFKPLYYSAAISSRKFTTASQIDDSPMSFENDDGTLYTPLNYKGSWKGSVLLRTALAKSMNVPAIQVLEGIGFDAAIERASRMLGYTNEEVIAAKFPRKYPLALGVISAPPIQMARAYATFPNNGRAVTPISIRYVEDRDGNIIVNPEKELREEQKSLGKRIQIMSPQEAYIMVDLLSSTVEWGTLRYASTDYLTGGYSWTRDYKDGLPMPMAGKTGTTQNWKDAWAVGFSPYVTTAVWFGFDEGNSSLGLNLTGASAAGPAWADYMRSVHQNLEPQEFIKPTGLKEVNVCAISGKLPTKVCLEGFKTEIFLSGTEPDKGNPEDYCEYHSFKEAQAEELEPVLLDIMQRIELPPIEVNISLDTSGIEEYGALDLDAATNTIIDLDDSLLDTNLDDSDDMINDILD